MTLKLKEPPFRFENSMRGEGYENILQAKHHVGDTCNDLGTKASWLKE